jgi:hypothetical protein
MCEILTPEEARRVEETIEGLMRVEEYNDQFRQPNPKGRYPLCKPKLFDIEHCERCGGWIKGIAGPCPAVPPENRWGEDNTG